MPLFRKKKAVPDVDATKVGGVVVRPPIAAGDLPAGAEVGAYRVEGRSGRGGMGVVYRAEHRHLGRAVALKLLAPGLGGDFRTRFVRESQLAASLSHPNIVTVYDAGEEEGALWIAMQLIIGTDLRQILRDEGRRDPDEVVSIARQVASALDAAHAAGLIHRDVKPANILMNGERAYLSDFGLTKRVASRTDLTAKNDIVGTPDYLAPEQIEGSATDGRVDQYALACVVHHSLTGKPPFEGDSDIAVLQAHLSEPPPRVSDSRDDVPVEADEVLARAMSKDPGDRFPSTSDFAAALAVSLGADEPASGARADAEAPNVLVGVADAATRAVIRAALGRGRAEVSEVTDAAALLEQAQSSPPGLVLLDVTLPGLDIEAALRALTGGADESVPVVVLAERGEDQQWRAARAAGAHDVLLRPFSAFQLLAKVRDHLPRALER